MDGEADLVGTEVGGSCDRQHGDDDREQVPHRPDDYCESEPRHRLRSMGLRHLALQERGGLSGVIPEHWPMQESSRVRRYSPDVRTSAVRLLSAGVAVILLAALIASAA